MQWTPTLLILDPEGTQRHRFEGYLPADEFLAQLHIGLAHAAFSRKQWDEAERRYRQVVEQFPTTEAAPEALYWSGVAKYKASGNPAVLGETAHGSNRVIRRAPGRRRPRSGQLTELLADLRDNSKLSLNSRTRTA